VGHRIPREHFARDWKLAETAKMLFVESDYDFACHHVTPINAFKDGGCSIQKAREARERWPGRFQVYAGVDPVFPEQALDSLEQQVEELSPVGLKLYPNSYTADGAVGWHMDDPEIAFPLFQRALDLGLKAVAIHKAIPLGPVPMDHYRMDDIDAAAAAFPDLQFEVVHGGFAFIEETAFQLARFSNVWVNLETTANLAVAKPAVFERVMAAKPEKERSTGSCGRRVPVFYTLNRRSSGSGNDFSSRMKCANERAFRKSLNRLRETFLDLIIFECMGLMRKLSRRTSKVMNSQLSGQKGNQSHTRPLTRKGLQGDDLFERRCDFAPVRNN
jgi:hypothetical protein